MSRSAFRSRIPYDLDSVNFALGIGHFDPRVYQPHPPGYFLYIFLGRLLNDLVHNANLALVLVSIAAGCGTVTLIYALARAWFGVTAARFGALLFVFSPLGWFHGTVALTYSVEGFFSALAGWLCWRMECGQRGYLLPLSVVLGVSAGVRPSSLLLLGPLYLFSLRKVPIQQGIGGVATLMLTLFGWFLPMIRASGGFDAYVGALESLWGLVPSRGTVFNSSPATSIARFCFLVVIYGLMFGAASLLPMAAGLGAAPDGTRKKRFTLVWILPALAFFTFIFLKFVNSGYLMVLAAPGCVWLGWWASEWYGKAGWPRWLKRGALGLAGAANVAIFLAFPGYCSYGSVRHFEAEMRDVQQSIPEVGAPGDLLLVSFDNHFLGYRHVGYELPAYTTLQYPEVKLLEGTRIFAMRGDETQLLAGLPSRGYSRFVLVPLPGGDAGNRRYLEAVEKLLPANDLRREWIGNHVYVSAPIRDLGLLFPQAALAPPEGVYALLHSPEPSVNSRAHRRCRRMG